MNLLQFSLSYFIPRLDNFSIEIYLKGVSNFALDLMECLSFG
jgi:hypothetical protein